MTGNPKSVVSTAIQELRRVGTVRELDALWRAYFGSKGAMRVFLENMKRAPREKRAALGKNFGEARVDLEKRFAAKRAQIERRDLGARSARDKFDVTRPGARVPRGHLHPLTVVERTVVSIFRGLGFSVIDGPEVETEWYNFDALNIPADHPARDLWDTLWLKAQTYADFTQKNAEKINPRKSAPSLRQSALLLRTHTSPVQVRYMETHNPPFRIIAPGRVYRFEATDASHDIQFHQVEGLMVGERGEVTVAHFKGIIQEFFRQFFSAKGGSPPEARLAKGGASGGKGGKDAAIRLRPSYFPFVEPGFEVDMACTACMKSQIPNPKSQTNSKFKIQNPKPQIVCSVCKGSRWLEMMGAGMVHPAVFEAVKYNPRQVQGFAFGMGIERLAMMKYKIPDIRLFRSGDLRFLKQF